jgi:outer membrane protein assembly factor BamB
MQRSLRSLHPLVGTLFFVSVLVLSFSFVGKTVLHAAHPPFFTPLGSWSQYGFTAQYTSFNTMETTLSPTTASHLTLAWKAPTNSTAQASQPAVANGIIYSASGSQVSAFQTATGGLLWTATIGGITNFISPIVSHGIVYVCASSASAGLYALDAQTGNMLWHQSLGVVSNAYAAPTLANGVLYEGWDNGKFYAFDASTGKVLWSVPMYSLSASAGVANGMVYVSSDIHLYALNAQDGKEV